MTLKAPITLLNEHTAVLEQEASFLSIQQAHSTTVLISGIKRLQEKNNLQVNNQLISYRHTELNQGPLHQPISNCGPCNTLIEGMSEEASCHSSPLVLVHNYHS